MGEFWERESLMVFRGKKESHWLSLTLCRGGNNKKLTANNGGSLEYYIIVLIGGIR